MLKTETKYRRPGEPVTNFSLFAAAWDECVELQMQPRARWVSRTLKEISEHARLEVSVSIAGSPIGGVVLAEDDDVHVGRCLTVVSQYVMPQHRNRGVSLAMMRTAIAVARQRGYPVLAYTHRLGPWRYETNYRRLS